MTEKVFNGLGLEVASITSIHIPLAIIQSHTQLHLTARGILGKEAYLCALKEKEMVFS